MAKAIPMTSSNVLKKQKRMRRIRDNVELYSLILPVLIHIFIFCYIPMYGILIAFQNYTPGSPILAFDGSVKWVGLKHFVSFVTSPMFPRLFYNTFHLSFLNLAFGFLCPILFALLVNELKDNFFKKFLQTTSYMPYFISTVVLVGMLKQFFNPHVGIYGIVYTFFTGSTASDLFASASAFDPLYIISGVWQSFGWGSILYLAALSGVSPELYEAATIDGATRFQRVLHVDIPAILPTIIIMLIMNAGSMLNVGFEKIYLMQTDMNLRVSEVISTFVYKRGLGSGGNSDYAFSTAVGLFNNVINLILLVTVNRIAARVSETSLW